MNVTLQNMLKTKTKKQKMELTEVTPSLAFKGNGYFSFLPTLQKTGRIYVPDLQKIM